jgi:hypothetical protein
LATKGKVKQTESAWELILASKDISESLSKYGYVEIQATELKSISGHEPRILAKMDFSAQRPQCFIESNLNILPIENGRYRIGNFNIFRRIDSVKEDPIFISSPIMFESVANATTSEGIALRKAEISTMIDLFSGEHVVHTFSGRERSPNFDFKVRNYDETVSEININGVQIEVDGGFEGENAIYIFEVKNLMAEDFNMRQLYFPFRTYMAKSRKPIRCIYLIHAHEVFSFFEYKFNDPLNMSSIELVKSQSYYLKDPVVELEEIMTYAESPAWLPDSNIPFPQADLLSAVIEIVELAGSTGATADELREKFDFSPRQLEIGGGYYPNAAKYLGLAQAENDHGELKLKATEVFQAASKRGTSAVTALVVSRISQIPGVKGILNIWVSENRIANLGEVVNEMHASEHFKSLGDSTKRRRAQTIRAWCIWVIQHSS